MDTPDIPLAIITVILGLTALTSGRRLFWLFVGVIGFAVGFQYAPLLFDVQSRALLLVLALVLGIGGALLAVFFQKFAVSLAGFAAGGYIAMHLLELFELGSGPLPWLPYAIGGVIGAILMVAVFDWALIFISSLAGASMIVHALSLSPFAESLLFFVLAIFGILLQARMFRQSTAAPPRTTQRET